MKTLKEHNFYFYFEFYFILFPQKLSMETDLEKLASRVSLEQDQVGACQTFEVVSSLKVRDFCGFKLSILVLY
jgi:hypothetical protein